MAIVALLAGGAFAATRSGAEGRSTAELTTAAKRATLTFTSVGNAAFPADLMRSLTGAVVNRLAA